MQAVARCTPVVGRARRYRSQPLKTGPCAAHPRRSRGCAERGPHKRLANPRSLGRPGFPQRLQRKIGSALIKLEQTGALRRCPPALLPAPRPAARPRAREARQLPHVLLPPALLRRRARRLGGAAPRRCSLPARPPRWRGSAASSRSWRAMCCWSTPLPQASCAAGELICRRAGRGASSGPEKLRPEEAVDGREPKAGGEGGEDQESRRGRGCGACMWR